MVRYPIDVPLAGLAVKEKIILNESLNQAIQKDIEHINVHKQPCEHRTHIHMGAGDGAEMLLRWQNVEI